MSHKTETLLVGWYLGLTPLFAILDLVFGIGLRVAWPEAPPGRLAYYLALGALGIVAWRLPPAAPMLAVLESAVAIGLVLVSAYTTILALPETQGPVPVLPWLVNLLLCGGIGIVAFQRSLVRLRGD